MKRGHPIRDKMSMVILQMQDDGELAKLKNKWQVQIRNYGIAEMLTYLFAKII